MIKSWDKKVGGSFSEILEMWLGAFVKGECGRLCLCYVLVMEIICKLKKINVQGLFIKDLAITTS